MAIFAKVADYAARYGEPKDAERTGALLADASAILQTEYEEYHGHPYYAGAHPAFDRSACAVCCSMVARAESSASVPGGATQLTQTAGSYSASVSFSDPAGSLYVRRGDLARLGLSGSRCFSVAPEIGGERCCR